MKVIRANHDKFSDLWILAQELHVELETIDPLVLWPDTRAVMLAYHRTLGWCIDDAQVVFMAYDGPIPVGYLHVQMFPFYGSERMPVASSFGFYIRPGYRNGPASFMLHREARRLLLSAGRTHVQAVVSVANKNTSGLYLAHGYAPIAVIYQRDVRHGRRKPIREGQPEAGGGSDGNNEGRGGQLPCEPRVCSDATVCSTDHG